MTKKELIKTLLENLPMAARDKILCTILAASNSEGILDYYDISEAIEGENDGSK